MADAAPKPYIPRALTAVTPYLLVSDISTALRFYGTAFGATEIESERAEFDGQIMHAAIRIDGAAVEIGRHGTRAAEDAEPLPPTAVHLYVADADAVVRRAQELGARVIRPPADQDYGDREATIADPFGIVWYVATRVQD